MYYSREFAHLLFRESMLERAIFRSLRPRMQALARDRDCEVTGLLPARADAWWPMLEDIWHSPAVEALNADIRRAQIHHKDRPRPFFP